MIAVHRDRAHGNVREHEAEKLLRVGRGIGGANDTRTRCGDQENPLAAAVQFTQLFSDPGVDWKRIAKIRSWTKLPVVLKGIMRADDAEKAVKEGYDGVMVSNHGGRQVDGGIGALDALAKVTAVVGGRVPVLFDSGIRCGADIFKAIALGASAAGIGRPYAYGLALGGEQGVQTVMEHLLAELDLTMALNGCPTPKDISRELLG